MENQLGGQKDLEGEVVLLEIVGVWMVVFVFQRRLGLALGRYANSAQCRGRVWGGGNREGFFFLLLFLHRRGYHRFWCIFSFSSALLKFLYAKNEL